MTCPSPRSARRSRPPQRASTQANERVGHRDRAHVAGPSGPIYIGIMLGLMVLGLLWLVVYYLWGVRHRRSSRPGQLELRDRLRADDRRPADDHAVALTACRAPGRALVPAVDRRMSASGHPVDVAGHRTTRCVIHPQCGQLLWTTCRRAGQRGPPPVGDGDFPGAGAVRWGPPTVRRRSSRPAVMLGFAVWLLSGAPPPRTGWSPAVFVVVRRAATLPGPDAAPADRRAARVRGPRAVPDAEQIGWSEIRAIAMPVRRRLGVSTSTPSRSISTTTASSSSAGSTWAPTRSEVQAATGRANTARRSRTDRAADVRPAGVSRPVDS